MEVLVRWRCHLCRQPHEARCSYCTRCSYCNGKGYLERWVPCLILRDVKALFKDTFLIRGCPKIPDFSSTCLD